MTTPSLTEIVDRLRQFERDARGLSVAISPLLRRGSAVTYVGYHNANDALLPAEILAPLHRTVVMLGDAIHIAGSAHFDLVNALAQHPDLQPAPPAPPDIEAVVEPIADVVERPAKVARRR
jgi:hypothetical protein